MMWYVIGAILILPLCASEVAHIPYRGDAGNLICELVMLSSFLPIIQLKKLCTVNTHMNTETSIKLNKYRNALKKFVTQSYPKNTYEVTYSPDRLSAAIVEKTNKKVPNYKELDFFNLIYIDDHQAIQTHAFDFIRHKRHVSYPPFFTPQYACLDFGLGVNPSSYLCSFFNGVCWSRATKEACDTRFFIACTKKQLVPTGWFAHELPLLYAKIMKQSSHFVKKKGIYSEKKSGLPGGPGFVFDLAHSGILTPKDVHCLSKFTMGGTYEEWSNVQDDNDEYTLQNILAWHANPMQLLARIDLYIGKKKIKIPGFGTFFASRCRDIVSFRRNKRDLGKALTDRFEDPPSTITQATLDYMQGLKEEHVYVETHWKEKRKAFNKRLHVWQKAMELLIHKRMTFITLDKYLIRYDKLSNRITVFSYVLGYLLKETHTPSTPIDIHSIQVIDGHGSISYSQLKEM